MIILGVFDGHNAGAALIKDGKVLKAAEEERFSRIKNHDGRLAQNGGPIESLKFCVNGYKNKIDIISLALDSPSTIQTRALNTFFESALDDNFGKRIKTKKIKNKILNLDNLIKYPLNSQKKRVENIIKCLKKNGVNTNKTKIKFCNHHFAHSSSAYYPSPFSKALIFTLDGKGDDLSGMVSIGDQNKMSIIKEINYIHSLGHFYSAITAVCGFRAIRDEGKITALSAKGKINHNLLNNFKKLIKVTKDGSIYSELNKGLYLGPYPHTLFGLIVKKLKKITTGIKRNDICRTAQIFTEEIILKLVNFYQKKYGIYNICLGGGIFSNVLINKRLYESNYTKKIYVHPAMTDAGLAVGSALFHYFQKNQKIKRRKNDKIYLGPEDINEKNIKKEIKRLKLSFSKPKNIEKEIGFLLSKGEAIARYCSAMEYGPRALGNRSILCNSEDDKVKIWLNKKLQRSNIMPFAPIILDKFAHKYFKKTSKAEYCTKYMTIALKVKKNMKNKIPSIIHDGTVRPQILKKKDNPKLYKILEHYRNFSGQNCLINTSFNLHYEPIVNTYFDALESFKVMKLKYMQCENLLVKS